MKQEDLRGLFYIVKGNYKPNLAPKIECADGVERYIGGYNPTLEGQEWYRVLDTETFFCSYAGGDYDKALEVIRNQIVHFKTRKKYFKWVSEISSEDYYFVHYLGHSPFTRDQHIKRCEGRMPRVSNPQKYIERAVYSEWGHFYDEDIETVEDEAYEKIEAKEKVFENKKKKLRVNRIESLAKPIKEEPLKRTIKKKLPLKKKIKLV